MKRRRKSMIGPAPSFTESEYFEPDPVWHFRDGASEADKKALEKMMNTRLMASAYKEKYPEMKHPYYAWNGKIIDKG